MKKTTIVATAFSLLFCVLLAAFKPTTSGNKKAADKSSQTRNNSSDTSTGIIRELYEKIGLASKGLAFETFHRAFNGYKKLYSSGKINNNVLTIADMSQPSCYKRLYIIDMNACKLLINTLVAHGRNSGEATAARFSNIPESLQSSLGFYVTGGTYEGNNGYSMRLFGMEKGFNDQAENRAIVMHGAPYVNEDIAKKTGRIGRSWGCPAVSLKEHLQIINTIKNGSCLYLYAPQKQYLAKSSLSNDDVYTL
jgi:hypothetical protein